MVMQSPEVPRWLVAIVILAGLTGGAAAGWLIARTLRSDNLPFLIALGSLVGLGLGAAVAVVLDRVGNHRQRHGR